MSARAERDDPMRPVLEGLREISERLEGLRVRPHEWTRSIVHEHHFETDITMPVGINTDIEDFTVFDNDRARAVMIKSIGVDYLLTAPESSNSKFEDAGGARFTAVANRVPIIPQFEIDFGGYEISSQYYINEDRYIFAHDFREINQVLRSGEKLTFHSELDLWNIGTITAELQCHARFTAQLVDIFDPRPRPAATGA